jgi:nucleotide-binding universal stress UspA family protein
MRELAPLSSAVVVGIDGSRSAIEAALWAVDEAADLDLPLRMVYAIQPREFGDLDGQRVAHDFAGAEVAVRQAAMAIESASKPVKIEVEILQSRPIDALLGASRSAAMLCLGALGINRASGKRVGSTVTGLLSRVHCPVSIIRQGGPKETEAGWIVTEFDDSPDATTVLGHALEEARLRHAPLRVLTTWHPRFNDIHDMHSPSDGSRQAKANLERVLTRYRRLYPELELRAVAVAGSPMTYLALHADSIQLIVLGQHPSDELAELIGPASCAALNKLRCSVLISERHSGL